MIDKYKNKIGFRKTVSGLILFAFLTGQVFTPSIVKAQLLPNIPAPGTMVGLSQPFNPPILKGVKVYSDNPFRFDFILDKGDAVATDDQLKTDSSRLIKYFLASLTVPEKDLWVNLSPYEKDRIVPQAFGQTQMGRDLLVQDYLLKQITASVIYPEDDVGKKFWDTIYRKAREQFGTTEIPVDTFNKVWILPQKAVVYENAKAGAAYVVESKLKVMLESDYLALDKSQAKGLPQSSKTQELGKQVVREIVIPALEKEVNEGKNFAQLRQVYQSLILAAWYKKKIKESLLSKAYVDQKKVIGVNIDDPNEAEKIWAQYVEAFKKGAFNFIKEEQDVRTKETLPRKYFSGGFDLDLLSNKTNLKPALEIVSDPTIVKQLASSPVDREVVVVAEVNVSSPSDTPNIKRKPALKDLSETNKPHVQAVVRHAGLEANGLGEYLPLFDLFRKASDHESGIIDRVKKILNNHFSPEQLKQNGDFLDVGASDGVIAEALMPYFKHGVAVEIDENASGKLKAKEIPRLYVDTTPIQEYLPNRKFDVILVSHSLYYIEEKDRIDQIKRMASWLKPGGKLILLYTVHGDSQKDLFRMKKALGVPSQAIDGRAIKDSLISEGFEASLEILESAVTADLDGMLKIAPFVLKKSSLQAETIKSQIQEYVEKNLWDETQHNYRLNIPQELLIISNGSGGHNKNALHTPQSDQSMRGDKEHVALYSFESREAIFSNQEVPLRYSAYKYGSQEQSDYFLGMLQTEILKKFGDQINSNPGQWVLATTGYSLNKPSIVPLARKLSAKLGIEYVSVRAVRKNRISGKPLIYADLKTSQAREAVQEMYEYCLESDQSYEGKNVIFIDDFFASGSALKKINTVLVNKYQMRLAGNFVIISIASMQTKDPAVEEEINSFLIRSKPLEEIAKLLNRKDTFVTRYTVAALFTMEMSKFKALVALLDDFYVSKLFIAVMQNYRDAADAEKMRILNDRIRVSSLNRETLINRLKQQNGGLVLLGGPSGAGKTTVADFLAESLGSSVLPVDFYPSDQWATKYGIKSHELFISHDNDLVWAHISQLLRGKEVNITSPYYYAHQFTRRINPPFNKPLIVDGLHAVNPDFIEGLPKSVPITKVFVDAPKQIRFMRRLLTNSDDTDYVATLLRWRNVIEAEEQSIDLSRNNVDLILVEPMSATEIYRLAQATSAIRASLRDHLVDLDERYDSRIVLKGILDDVESFIEERGVDHNLNTGLEDEAQIIRSKRKGLKVAIIGSAKPSEKYAVADGERLGRALADYLRPFEGVAFTGGDLGVGADFYRGYFSSQMSKDRFFVLLPTRFGPNEEYEKVSSNNLSIERLGTSFTVRNIGTALVGDVFIVINGNNGTTQEVIEALRRGKPVVALNYGGVGEILYQAKKSGKIPQDLQDKGLDENALKFIILGDITNISQALDHARELVPDDAQIMDKGGSELTQDKVMLISTDGTAVANASSSLLSNIESFFNQTVADMQQKANLEDELLLGEINDRIQKDLQILKLRAEKGSFVVGNLEDLLRGQEKLIEGLRKAPPVILEFPGTFDPPHLNHVNVMLQAVVGVSGSAQPRTYYAVFAPINDRFSGEGDSGAIWKPNKSSFEHRYQMTKLLSKIFSPLFSAIDTSRYKGAIDMLASVLDSDLKPLTDFYTIAGADNLEHLETYIAKDLSAVPPGIRMHFVILNDFGHPDVVARLSRDYPDNVIVVNDYSQGLRSTQIRTQKRIGVLPISLQKYIQEKSLYGTADQEIKTTSTPVKEAQAGNTKTERSLDDNFMNAQEQLRKGGIDLTGYAKGLQVHSAGQGIEFNFDADMVKQLQNASGLTPVIIDIQPMTTTVPMFLELEKPEMAFASG